MIDCGISNYCYVPMFVSGVYFNKKNMPIMSEKTALVDGLKQSSNEVIGYGLSVHFSESTDGLKQISCRLQQCHTCTCLLFSIFSSSLCSASIYIQVNLVFLLCHFIPSHFITSKRRKKVVANRCTEQGHGVSNCCKLI
jgi:hypothetical protein